MTKRRLFPIVLLLLILSLGCTSVSGLFGTPDPNDPGYDPKEYEDDSISFDMTAVARNAPTDVPVPTQAPVDTRCDLPEVLQTNVLADPELAPDVVVWANGEAYPAPTGYILSYPEAPATNGYDKTRIISGDGSTISVTTTTAVSCAGVYIPSNYVSPVVVKIDNEIIYNGFLYPATAQDRPVILFYIRTGIQPPRPVTISVTGYAPEDNDHAYVPVEFFGFNLP